MKKFTKSLVSGLMLVGLTTISAVAIDNTIVSPQTNVASAKVKKIVWTHNLKHTRYLISKGNFYNKNLSKSVWKAQNHATKDWTTLKSEKVKKTNGKYDIYYEMKSGNKTGWIWRGYVQKSKKFVYNSKTMIKRSTFNKDFDVIIAARNSATKNYRNDLSLSDIYLAKKEGAAGYHATIMTEGHYYIDDIIQTYSSVSDPKDVDSLWKVYKHFRSRLSAPYREDLDNRKSGIFTFNGGTRERTSDFVSEFSDGFVNYGKNIRYIY